MLIVELILLICKSKHIMILLPALHAGFEALTEIQNLLGNTNNQELAVRESLIVAASNRFFTLIPSIHPHIIQDEDDLMVKVCVHYLVLYSCILGRYSMTILIF